MDLREAAGEKNPSRSRGGHRSIGMDDEAQFNSYSDLLPNQEHPTTQ